FLARRRDVLEPGLSRRRRQRPHPADARPAARPLPAAGRAPRLSTAGATDNRCIGQVDCGANRPGSMILPLAVTVALVSSAPPAAKGPSLAPGTKLEQGQRAFNEGQLDAALKLLDAAAAEGGEAATVEKVQLLRGQCLAARADFSKAEEAFAFALDA